MDSCKRVLIVDDSKLTRMIISKIIEENFTDWIVTEAVDATSAIEQAQQNQFDFITLDYNMPGLSGYDVYPILNELQTEAHIAVFTANIQKAVKQKFEALGASFYCKPIDQDVILDFFAVEA
ncbi:MAG: response regulator [Gammaproteobacteria bacterium]|nr:response regulator [Gammaproteobacteria bacterium]